MLNGLHFYQASLEFTLSILCDYTIHQLYHSMIETEDLELYTMLRIKVDSGLGKLLCLKREVNPDN